MPREAHEGGRTAAAPVAVVTGGSRGIGLATALAFAERGYRVALLARASDVLDGAVAAVRAAGADARAFPVDLTDRAGVEATARRLGDAYPRVDALVNNAGGTPLAAFGSEDDDWDGTIALNLLAAGWLVRGLLPRLARGSAIVNVGSVMSHAAVKGLASYAAAKGGLDQLTRALAVELGGRGIRVNAVSPGFVATELFESHHPPARREALAASHALERVGRPPEIAAAIVWLCGPESSFVSGAVVPVDGGLTARLAIPPLL